MKKIQTTCNYCSLGCNLDFYVEGEPGAERIARINPAKEYPVNRGFACIKGLSLDRQISERRSPLPLIRNDRGLRETASWDAAFKHTAQRIREIQGKYGAEGFAAISTGQLTLEEMALLGHIGRNCLKINVDGNTRLCMATSVAAHKQAFGFDAPPYTLADLEYSDTIILIGANPVVAHPIIWDRIRFSPMPHKLIVIDPRRSETARNADEWYGLKPKSDLTFLYALANLLIEKGWIDAAYIEKHTEGFSEFKAAVRSFTPQYAAEITGISGERLLALAETIRRGKAVSCWWTMGVNQGYEAVRTAQAIIAIALMTGNMGRPGTGANSITGQIDAMGSRLFSNTAGLYGGGDFDNPKRRGAVARALQCEESLLALKPTIPYNAIVENINAGKIKGLWILCTNPRHSWANNETFRTAAENLELFIVQDIYGDTDSAELSTVFLPVVPGIKKEGTMINTERRLSALRPVLPKSGEEKNDMEVLLGIGGALGLEKEVSLWRTPKGVFNLMKECSRGMPCDITGVDYDGLAGSKGVQWPCPQGASGLAEERRLYEDGVYYTPSGKAKFIFEQPLANPLPQSEDFPLYLNTGRGTVGQWHTQTRTREVAYVADVSIKKAHAAISPGLAAAKGVNENDVIEITSSNGQRARFYARIDSGLDDAQVFAPIHYIETNKLTLSVYDSYSKEPSYKYAPVSVQKVAEGGRL
ncbi:MAG: molybdopterin-dependent oxidoreductase [Treponema sp.]|jgi:assimilatory nitrate reductase catalytic subunit|nr:molybdopterin-dependent oxidoreductase [Treponema sp.]